MYGLRIIISFIIFYYFLKSRQKGAICVKIKRRFLYEGSGFDSKYANTVYFIACR